MNETLRVSVYLNEADQWHHRPLHLELLRALHAHGIAGGTVLRAVAGFTHAGGVASTSLVDAGGKLPLVVQFVDEAAKVSAVLPVVREMVGTRLVVRERVDVVE
jgi:hypothetical protein